MITDDVTDEMNALFSFTGAGKSREIINLALVSSMTSTPFFSTSLCAAAAQQQQQFINSAKQLSLQSGRKLRSKTQATPQPYLGHKDCEGTELAVQKQDLSRRKSKKVQNVSDNDDKQTTKERRSGSCSIRPVNLPEQQQQQQQQNQDTTFTPEIYRNILRATLCGVETGITYIESGNNTEKALQTLKQIQHLLSNVLRESEEEN